MEQTLTLDDLQEFEKLTQYPLTDFLVAFQSFVKRDIPNIVAYYSGNQKTLDNSSNNNLTTLQQQIQDIFATITLNKTSFRNYKWWVLLDNLELIDNLLIKMNVVSKWLRSSITNASFNQNPQVQIPFNQGQTLESVARTTLGSADWDNTWEDLALENNLREEDYTPDAGFLLTAHFKYNVNNFKINTIVDNPIGKNVLGLDLPVKKQFDGVGDFVVLSPEDTFAQTCKILIELKKGDNPEFPTQGLSPSLVVGSNINSLSYPAVFRQLVEVFKADDTIGSFTLVSIRREADAVYIDFQCSSRLSELQPTMLTLSI